MLIEKIVKTKEKEKKIMDVEKMKVECKKRNKTKKSIKKIKEIAVVQKNLKSIKAKIHN